MSRSILKAGFLTLMTLTLFSGCRQESSPPQDTPTVSRSAGEGAQAGEALFKQYCSPCHPDGGNVTDPQRSLRGSVLKANRIKKPEDIVRIMRHPISRMTRFDQQTISDRDAFAIAEYILTTFK